MTEIANLNVYECEMQDVVRQEKESGILFNSTILRNYIRENEIVDFPLFLLNNFYDIERIDGRDLEECLNKEYSSNELGDVVVICRTNKRANLFNQEIRRRIFFAELNTGDFLMVVKNN